MTLICMENGFWVRFVFKKIYILKEYNLFNKKGIATAHCTQFRVVSTLFTVSGAAGELDILIISLLNLLM